MADNNGKWGWFQWLIMIAAIAYALFPFDIVPDLIPFIGWIDDVIILSLAYGAAELTA